jgi:hypothetical protein
MRKQDYAFQLVFARGAQWYEISVSLPAEEKIPESDWWPYFMSFKAQDTPATSPATMTAPGSP